MMMSQRLTVYKASAGSGKTFTLAIQYIKILVTAEHKNPHRHILAVTFTNKATAEMKDRILQQLYAIWKALPSGESYLAVLQQELTADGLSLSHQEIRWRAGQALLQILHDYSHFRVETIDSFFQSVMKNLAHELSLTANLKVDLNDKEVLSRAVDRIMERLHIDLRTLNWILEYVDDRIKNNDRWDVSREIKGFASWIFKEAYLTRSEELNKILPDDAKVKKYRDKLRFIIASTKDSLKSAAEHFFEELENRNITCTLFSRGTTLQSYLIALQAGKLDAEFKITLQNYLDDPMNMLKKADQKKPELCSYAIYFQELLAEIHQFQEKVLIQYTSAILALKYLNPLRLLGVIDEEVTTINNETNRFLLAKTPILLNELIDESDAPFIFEKMGSVFHHIMIDEFQDTSTLQWKNFKALLLESMAGGSSNLLVGDVKQSIYRWRSGDWTILNNIETEMKNQQPDIRPLTVNHRSERRIILFNNELFKEACKKIDALMPQASIKISSAYSDVEQECPSAKQTSGHVRIKFYKESRKADSNWEEQMLNDLVEQVEALHQQGLPFSEMAILVRKRAHAAPIVRYFAEKMPQAVLVSDEAFILSSSLSVNMLVAAMRYLNDPQDAVSLTFLIAHYQRDILQKDNLDWNTLLLKNKTDYLPIDFHQQYQQLKLLPLYELQESLFHLFELHKLKGQDAYLFAFFDQITAYLQDHPADLSSFLAYWDEQLSEKSIPSGEIDGIRIFTIHKSKGLQFHTVLLPYCHWDIEKDRSGFSRNNDLLWCQPTEAPFNEFPLLPIVATNQMSRSIFYKEYEEEHLQRRVDSLNTLYVALTRAEKNLYIWGKTKFALDENSTTGDVIYTSLPIHLEDSSTVVEEMELKKEATAEVITTYIYGEPNVHVGAKKTSHNRLELDYTPQHVVMQSFAAQMNFRQSNRSEAFIKNAGDEDESHAKKNTNGDYLQQGKLLHYIFSNLRTEKDIEKTLRKFVAEGLIGNEIQAQQLNNLVRKGLQREVVNEWFKDYWILYNECAILSTDPQTGECRMRRPDRVMMSEKETVVVDFKFGTPRPEYPEQVKEYMELLSKMVPKKKVKGYLWYVYINKVVEVTV